MKNTIKTLVIVLSMGLFAQSNAIDWNTVTQAASKNKTALAVTAATVVALSASYAIYNWIPKTTCTYTDPKRGSVTTETTYNLWPFGSKENKPKNKKLTLEEAGFKVTKLNKEETNSFLSDVKDTFSWWY